MFLVRHSLIELGFCTLADWINKDHESTRPDGYGAPFQSTNTNKIRLSQKDRPKKNLQVTFCDFQKYSPDGEVRAAIGGESITG